MDRPEAGPRIKDAFDIFRTEMGRRPNPALLEPESMEEKG